MRGANDPGRAAVLGALALAGVGSLYDHVACAQGVFAQSGGVDGVVVDRRVAGDREVLDGRHALRKVEHEHLEHQPEPGGEGDRTCRAARARSTKRVLLREAAVLDGRGHAAAGDSAWTGRA